MIPANAISMTQQEAHNAGIRACLNCWGQPTGATPPPTPHPLIPTPAPTPEPGVDLYATVWVAGMGGYIYHAINHCGTMNPNFATYMTRQEARDEGRRACLVCWAELDATPEPTIYEQTTVWTAGTGGTIYHSINNCGNMNPDNATSMTQQEAHDAGIRACLICW